jgi:hypothetical protein
MSLTTLPISGVNGKADYKIGAGSVNVIAVSKWEYNPKPNLLDLPNTTDGRRRVAGLPDYDGSIEVHVDTASTIDTDLVAGVTCTLNLYTDGTKKIGPLTAIIGDAKYSNSVEGSYDYTIPFMMAGGKTLPAGPA